MAKRLIPAVGYLRRSTDKQEASIADQRKAIERYAAQHGYKIGRWYIDDAISGDETAKRLDFQRMIADATDRADFEAILCWDQDRFGRFDSLEAGFWIHPLRQAGVYLVPINEGRVDWNDFTGRLMYGIKQEGKHQFLRDLSRNVLRGQIEAAKAGSWIGSVPYGYRIEGPKKQKRLIVDDPAKVKVVRRIFREFVEGRSMSDIARRLTANGIKSPGGREVWQFDAVRTILDNVVYVGTFRYNRFSSCKYHACRGGEVVPAKKRGRNDPADWIVIPDNHEAIIDQETFDRSQAILAKGKTGRAPYKPDENPYLLTGKLRCGRCGRTMHGLNNGKFRYYECRARKYYDGGDCEGSTIREDRILTYLADHLENWLGLDGEAISTAAFYGGLKADDLPEAFAEIRKLLMPRRKPRPDRKRLAEQLEQVTARIAKARENLVELDRTNIPAAQERIRQLDEQRAELERELRQKARTDRDINETALAVLNSLYNLIYICRSLVTPADDGWEVCGSLESAAPQALKRFLARVDCVKVFTAKKGSGTGTRHEFERGELVLGVGGKSNPHRTD